MEHGAWNRTLGDLSAPFDFALAAQEKADVRYFDNLITPPGLRSSFDG